MAIGNQMSQPTEEWRIKPAYTIVQAAWLSGVSSATVRRWLYGYDQPGHQMRPVFGSRATGDPELYLSFLELAEIIVASGFRRRGVKLERVRRAREFAKKEWGLDFPFATLKMKTDGRHILSDFQTHEPGVSLLVLDMEGQLTLPGLVKATLQEFAWLGQWASRWFPGGEAVPIVVDPQMGAGKPTVRDRGVTVDIIMRRFTKSKQSPAFIASDFELEESNVIDIIRYASEHQRLFAA